MSCMPTDEPLLEMEAMIGFAGSVPGGLKMHPDSQHLIYSVGSKVIIEDVNSKKQDFLSGHTREVSCLAVSRSGKYVASGQITHMGFKADVILWDFEKRAEIATFTLHKVKVQALAFSPNDEYLVSLGGEDDGSVVVWDLCTKQAICGAPAQIMSAGTTHTVKFTNHNDNCFVSGGNGTLRVWHLDRPNRKIIPTDVKFGQLKRVIKCIEMADDDKYFYCGTTTGDVMAVNMSADNTYNFQTLGPEKGKFSLGVTALAMLKQGDLLVGAGDGSVAVVRGHEFKFKKTEKKSKVVGAVTSLALRGQGHQFFCGTDQSSMYRFTYSDFSRELIKSCHSAAVNDIAFPRACSLLLVTCSFEEIRVWSTCNQQELLRITLANKTCNAVELSSDGKTIVSGWDDCAIRGFYPESGRLMYTIENGHHQPVTALACYNSSYHIVSGGKDGQVRIWSVEKQQTMKGSTFVTKLIASLKEHKAAVTCIKLRKNDMECVTSSIDGSCIIWDLCHQVRLQMIHVNTLFKYVLYHPDEHQILTAGTDRKIGYWEASNATMIREIDGSKSGSINAMGISADGNFFVSAGDDKLVNLFLYEEGEQRFMGIGHSAAINRVEISPDESFIISTSEDGAIIRWKFPQSIKNEQQQQVSYY